jgi:hypothetical protein
MIHSSGTVRFERPRLGRRRPDHAERGTALFDAARERDLERIAKWLPAVTAMIG